MSFWKKIGDGLGKAGQSVGNFFVEDVPHFVTDTIPSLAQRETYAPDLPPLRKEVAKLREDLEQARETFFAERAKLQIAETRYAELAERFSDETKSETTTIETTVRLAEDVSKLENTMGDIASASRTVAGVVTLGLAELLFMQGDNKKEREALEKEKVVISGMLRRHRNVTASIVSVRIDFEAEIALLEKKMAEAGVTLDENAASKMTEMEAERNTRLEMAARYLVSMPPEMVAQLTGLSVEELQDVTPHAETLHAEADASAEYLSEEEKQLLAAATAERTT